MNKCRVCGSDNIQPAMHLERVPRDVQRLITARDIRDRDHSAGVDFDVFQCHDCGLVQAPMKLGDDYYDDYLMSQSHSTQLQDYLNDLVADFLMNHAPKTTHVLDVGAGDGIFMTPFQQRGISVEGIEPSDRSRAIAKAQGLKVYPGYLGAETKLPGAPYDAFVTRQVLEHVDDIRGLLKGLRANLMSGACGIIEIPRLEKTLEDNRFYDFFPDHINYFTLKTLRTTLELNGFEVLDLRSTMFDEYNVAFVRMRDPVDFVPLKNTRISLIHEIENVLKDNSPSGTAIWGAGAKGLSILSQVNTGWLDIVVDSDPNKIGKFTPISECYIYPPEEIMLEEIQTVIISAVAYQNKILEKLQAMHYQGNIYLIGGHGLIKHQ